MTIEQARKIIGCVGKGWLKIHHTGGEYEFCPCESRDIYSLYFPIDTDGQREVAAKWLCILGGRKFNGRLCKYHKQSMNVYGGCKMPGAYDACIDILPCERFDRRIHRKRQE
jgi:hypothetical protein